jgi:aspartate-semialdehyde dehydrogenase
MSGYVAVIIGADTDVGREVAAVLRERHVPLDAIRRYADAPVDGSVEADDSEDEILPLAELDLDDADVVFVCGHAERAPEWIAIAGGAGAVVIDVTHAVHETGGAALIVPEVNATEIEAAVDRGVIACPVPTAVALAVVLGPIHAAAELKRVVVTSLEPVSVAGRAGVDELAQQTRDLLSGRSVEATVFPQRVAFNLIPQLGDFLAGGRTRGEWLIESQTRALLDLPDLPMAVSSICVPTFFGQAATVWIETERALDAVAVAAILQQAPGVLFGDANDPGGFPTLADVIGSEATHVGRVRDDPSVPFGIALWVAIDGLRKGGAVNAVQIAELALQARS